MKEFIKGMYDKPHIWKRIVLCLIAVCIMGICVSWMSLLAWGTDPCSVMNMAIAKKIGLTFGNWQAFLNVLLFLIVIWKDKGQIGFGTVFNMFLVGYACDFMTWARKQLLPEFAFTGVGMKLAGMIFLLAIFVVAVSIYMSVDLGTAPYDAVPIIIANSQDRVSFRAVRVIWDITVTIIGFAAGGVVGIVTVLMAFSIGPMAAFVRTKIEPFIR